MKMLLQGFACLACGALAALGLLVGLMFTHSFTLIEALMQSGLPLARLSLEWLSPAFWQGLTGLADAAQNASVRSFLQLCAALGQLALLVAAALYRGFCWR
ncbi:MAG: hypothetical protein ABWY06_03715 [Pseudomonas sp.]|uniref:hypothetical protein n=1 Tax=Pseudomonas sp. TaxID=306 RepID=UPI00339B7A40